jgi:hemerythrin
LNKIEWNDSLSVGVALIDEQHKEWIKHLNDLAAAFDSHLGVEHIAQTLGFLIDYTYYHFGTEEKHMTAHNYPGLAAHRLKHGELKTTLKNLVDDFQEEGATQPLADAIDTFLGNWLINHIEEVDRAFGTFLKENGITI